MPVFLLPRYVDGRGVAFLSCSDEAAARFRFDLLPSKWPHLAGWGDRYEDDLSGARYSGATDPYRIAVPGKWASGAAAKVRFRLGKRTPKATLEVIAKHLDEEGIDWLYFTNASGSRVTTPALRTHYLLQKLTSRKAALPVNA
jgi:hypothetical protein